MTFAGSIFLIAVGAILRFATHFHVQGVDIRTVGVILMIAGVIALILSIWQWATLTRRERAGVVVDQPPVVERREPPRY
jgi:uncharacterized membrane protein YidH (DUF202 family)